VITSDNSCEFEPIIVEIIFKLPLLISGIIFFNHNVRDELSKGVKSLDIFLDDKKLNNNNRIILHKGIGLRSEECCQKIKFPIINYTFTEEELLPFREFKPASLSINQDYETPYLPSGFIFKFSLISSWGDETYIGLKRIDFFDQNGNSILKYLSPKIISLDSCENSNLKILMHSQEGALFSFNSKKFLQNEDKNIPSIFYIFERPVCLSYIQIWNYSNSCKSGVREIIISADEVLIYKGFVGKAETEETSNCFFFTSDKTITGNISQKVYSENIKEKQYSFMENSALNVNLLLN
jgi:hypothetical protein